MPWKVRFREKDFIGWDPEFEFEVRGFDGDAGAFRLYRNSLS
jgi:hypothetical protein